MSSSKESCTSLQCEISCIDFAYVSALFLGSNSRILASKSAIQQKDLSKLVKSNIFVQGPNKDIFSFSIYELSDGEKRLLAKGSNFSSLPKYLDYADYLVNFELFCKNISNLGILSSEGLGFVKTRTNEAVVSSYPNYNNIVPQYPPKKSFLLYKICGKVKISQSTNLTKIILLSSLTKQII